MRTADRLLPLWPLQEGQPWAQKTFSHDQSQIMPFCQEHHSRNVPTPPRASPGLENGVRAAHPWLGDASKAPGGGSGGLITASDPEEGLYGSGVSVSHFLLNSWKPVGGI